MSSENESGKGEEKMSQVTPKKSAGATRTPATSATRSLADVASARSANVGKGFAGGSGLEARGIHAWFGKKHVLQDISMEFATGTVTALIGPSGCGKSTFIRTLNRMHEFIPTAALAGQVLLDGKDVYDPGVDVTKIRLKVGMVFQKPNPFPSMTIKENVLSGLKLSQIKIENSDELLESCLKRAGLWDEVKDRLNEYGGSLSGGQQQRLCIARSLAVNPQVLLMDEPCSALDPVTICNKLLEFPITPDFSSPMAVLVDW